ncbi:MAG: TIGR03960 family B12-binding radical SAM protein [Deltaproteobacteria bacterium]|nr:TIGR03960 family B12-binding radical SAM protein [Deltaproteobacteria bacterium]
MNNLSFKDLLPLVSKPSRYLGTEVNSIHKDLDKVDVRIALAFPDVYEVGMSHQGLHILYHILNSIPEVAAERVYAPWLDMEKLLRERSLPLSSLESNLNLREFDILGFSIQYDLSHTNMLNMMELAGIPIWASERDESFPLIIAGGPCLFNPEPVADFLDAALIGDGEEAFPEIVEVYRNWKLRGCEGGKLGLLRALTDIKGMYVPSFFDVSYNDDGTMKEIRPKYDDYRKVEKRIVADLNTVPYPDRPLVPFMAIVHDRVTLEVTRGCTRGCRFCQAGMIYRPARERTPSMLQEIAEKALRSTGYEDLTLLSLSTGDYSFISDLLANLMDRYSDEKIAISLPSMRVDTMSPELISEIKRVRKTGFTMAPEAGSERLRDVINKGITEAGLLNSVRQVFEAGWETMKLYFMIGLPTETDEDLMAIAELSGKALKIARKAGGKNVTASVASFVPKPHTPFQWEEQIGHNETKRRHDLLRRELKKNRVTFKWHEPAMSELEGVFARGDRRLSKVIARAFELGCRFDGWGEVFRFDLWQKAFEDCGLDPLFYLRKRGMEETLPWDHIDSGISKKYLKLESKRSYDAVFTPDCRYDECSGCGLCDFKTIKNRIGVRGQGSGVRKFHRPQLKPKPTLAVRRIRLTYSKLNDARFLGHLELSSLFARAVRRAGVPVRYSAGFHPAPKITFSPPISLGMESLEEFADIEIEGYLASNEARDRLNLQLPEGIRIETAIDVPISSPAVTSAVTKSDYEIKWSVVSGQWPVVLRDFMARGSFLFKKERTGREYDIRPLIERLDTVDNKILMTIKSGKEGGIKPGELMQTLFGLGDEETRLLRVVKTRTYL